jgi:hypothetical protein
MRFGAESEGRPPGSDILSVLNEGRGGKKIMIQKLIMIITIFFGFAEVSTLFFRGGGVLSEVLGEARAGLVVINSFVCSKSATLGLHSCYFSTHILFSILTLRNRP